MESFAQREQGESDASPHAQSSPGSEPDTNNRDSLQVPSISLPNGGGTISGMGEKFAANPVTGTGSMTVPIPTSPGRSGFGPELSLAYDSASGNGPFGFGWSLSLPSITRKTDKGLPQYRDEIESDVYILSGAEDLVPLRREDSTRHVDNTLDPDYTVRRYRPRVEGLFARIERWTRRDTGEIHWRSISRDNITSIYGPDNESRIFDPADHDPEHPTRIFRWLLRRTYDDKGNVIVYDYATEDEAGVDLRQSNERNRVRTAARYLKRIRYGNRTSRLAHDDWESDGWLFEALFDYDEGHFRELPWDPTVSASRQHHRVQASSRAGSPWTMRPDPFSSYRAGFELRTYRRCRRVLMFHHFDELKAVTGGQPYLVGATEFDYRDLDYDPATSVEEELAHPGSTRFASFIQSVTQSRFVHDPDAAVDEGDDPAYVTYLKKSLPPLEFQYTKAHISEEVRELDKETLENLPVGIDNQNYRWVDLDGEGLSGVLAEQGGVWHYKSNLGEGRFGALRTLPSRPNVALASGAQQLVDLSGNGHLDIAAFNAPTPGFYQRSQDDDWEPFRSFGQLPNIRWDDPNLRFVDLDGDGRADLLLTENEVFTWYRSLGEEGFEPALRLSQALNEEQGPRLVVADGTQSIYLADMCGDGLVDLVRIRNGEVCYWPNLGYGRFGAKVAMDNAPRFDNQDQFDQQRVRLADIDGSGTNDIIYLHRDSIRFYFNQCGNRWSDPRALNHFPLVDNLSSVMTADLLGNGTACLVWSSPLPARARSPVRYINLMGEHKPHLLVHAVNNLGLETEVTYAPSTKFYLADKRAGTPWVTRIPFPVHCVEQVAVTDHWRGTRFSTSYSYHHGYFDGEEREFRGFGRVEQVDSEHYGEFAAGNTASPYITDDHQLYQPPIKTVTWYHTGAMLDRHRILSQYAGEYFPKSFEDSDPAATNVMGTFREKALPEPNLVSEGLTTDEWREALRACKGMVLRQEIYELDVDALADQLHRPVRLFSTATHNAHIRMLQGRDGNRHAVFLVTESEAMTYHYELDLRTPDIHPDPRIAHTLNLNVDAYGNVLQSVAAVYRRIGRHSEPDLPPDADAKIAQVQGETHLAYSETRYTNDVDEVHDYRLRLPCEVRTYELSGISPETTDGYFTPAQLRQLRLSHFYQPEDAELSEAEQPEDTGLTEVEELPYHQLVNGSDPQKRVVEQVRNLFFDSDLETPLPLAHLNSLGLPFESYTLALTDELLAAVFSEEQLNLARADLEDPAVSGYHRFPATPQQFWIRSGVAGFHHGAAQNFYMPERYIDAFGNETHLQFDNRYQLFLESSRDAVDNITRVTAFDYRTLAPREIQDPNDNLTEVAYDILGQPAAMAVKGKGDGSEGDHLTPFASNINLTQPSSMQVSDLFTDPYRESELQSLLSTATARHLYWFGETIDPATGAISYGTSPAGACGILRETHVAELEAGATSPIQVSFEYSDGGGNLLATKIKAEPEREGGPIRWLTNGKTVLNNKGKPVKQYEPYFSTSEQRFEEPVEVGVTPIIYYDAAGRVVRTEQPDGSYSRVAFSPWHVKTHDQNDTVLEPDNAWYAAQSPLDPHSPLPRHPITNDILATPEQRSAWLAAQHADTPATVFLDSLGREVISIAHNKYRESDGTAHDEKYVTFTKLDAEGKPLWIRDARGNLVMQYITPQKPTRWSEQPDETIPSDSVPCYDIAGNLLYQYSMDGGERWMLNDAAGQPLYSWDFNNRFTDDGTEVAEHRVYHTTYDALRRPLAQTLSVNGDSYVIERLVYGEDQTDDKARNLRGQLHQHYDQSGLLTHQQFDFKGNLLQSRRQLTTRVKDAVIDWSEGFPPEQLGEVFSKSETFDALNRMTRLENWHRTGRIPAVYTPQYNERGLLVGETLSVRGETTEAIRNIEYNAKGQRTRIDLGNGTITRYDYDPYTFRLRQLRTTKDRFDPAFPNERSDLDDARIVQNLFYSYDTVGNITEIRDDAFEPAFFANQQVEPESRYVYDALYRLIEASGREQLSTVGAPSQRMPDAPAVTFPVTSATAPNALRNYTQRYVYDSVGNILQMQHIADNSGGWTRHYRYANDNNRLTRTWTGSDDSNAVHYGYDIHGSMRNLNRAPEEYNLRWDYRDMIRSANLGGGGWAWYSYDAEKQRTCKRIESGSNTVEERYYLGGMEYYRRQAGGDIVEEIETHHLFVDDQRLLIVEDVIQTDDDLPETVLYQYQYSNHLGSVGLELNEGGDVISYEEYHPYGTTGYQAKGAAVRAKAKQYRYTGMERDEETGLSYHTSRYYLPWLGRWVGVDPLVTGHRNSLLATQGASGDRLDPENLSTTENTREPPGVPTELKPWWQESSYSAFGLNPIIFVDDEGADYYFFFQSDNGDWEFQQFEQEGPDRFFYETVGEAEVVENPDGPDYVEQTREIHELRFDDDDDYGHLATRANPRIGQDRAELQQLEQEYENDGPSDIALLSRLIYSESGNAAFDERTSVGETVRNRVEYRGVREFDAQETYADVIFSGAYSAATARGIYHARNAFLRPVTSSSRFPASRARFLESIRAALTVYLNDSQVSGGALWYARPNAASNLENAADAGRLVRFRVGPRGIHHFFREP